MRRERCVSMRIARILFHLNVRIVALLSFYAEIIRRPELRIQYRGRIGKDAFPRKPLYKRIVRVARVIIRRSRIAQNGAQPAREIFFSR